MPLLLEPNYISKPSYSYPSSHSNWYIEWTVNHQTEIS